MICHSIQQAKEQKAMLAWQQALVEQLAWVLQQQQKGRGKQLESL